MRLFETLVPPQLDGAAAETVLRQVLGLSTTRIKRAKFQRDGITLDGVGIFSDAPVRAGQRLALHLPEQADSDFARTPGFPDILYEDEWLLAVNKPAGMPMYPGPGHYADTLGNHFVWLMDSRGTPMAYRPVNRLDVGTSGVLVLAKSAQTHEALQAKLHTSDFCRDYLALTAHAPTPPAGRIDAPIGAIEGEKNRFCVREDGKPALTEYETLGQLPGCAVVALRLHTGRSHQIRVHLAHLGCPLLGDGLYGGAPELTRPALHSVRLRLRHPFCDRTLDVRAPIPADFMQFGLEESFL